MDGPTRARQGVSGALLGLRSSGSGPGTCVEEAAISNSRMIIRFMKPKCRSPSHSPFVLSARAAAARGKAALRKALGVHDTQAKLQGPATTTTTTTTKRGRVDHDHDDETPVLFSRRKKRITIDTEEGVARPAWLNFSADKDKDTDNAASRDVLSNCLHPRRIETPFQVRKNPFAVTPPTMGTAARTQMLARATPTPTATAAGPPGFYNVGNTCYLNSVVQCLLACEPFVGEITRLVDVKAIGEAPCTRAIYDLIVQRSESRSSPTRTTLRLNELKAALALTKIGGAVFGGLEQQDAHEALLLIQQVVEGEVGKENFRCPFAHGVLVEVTCEACGYKGKAVEDGHLNVLVGVRGGGGGRGIGIGIGDTNGNGDGNSIGSALRKTNETVLRNCEQCKAKDVEHTRTSLVTSLPSSLVVQLRRFEYAGGAMHKIGDGFVAQKTVVVSADGSKRFELRSMVRHHGVGLASGHYDARVRRDGTWWACDDSTVVPVSEQDALGASASSYLLFYDLV